MEELASTTVRSNLRTRAIDFDLSAWNRTQGQQNADQEPEPDATDKFDGSGDATLSQLQLKDQLRRQMRGEQDAPGR